MDCNIRLFIFPSFLRSSLNGMQPFFFISEYVWMDSDHLADLMRDSDENQEVLQTTTHNNSNQSDKRAENGGSEEIAIREQIDDDEPTFYNDSTKIELQLQESSGQQGLGESGMTSNRNGIQDKMKRYVF